MENGVSSRARQTPPTDIRTRSSVQNKSKPTQSLVNSNLSNHQVNDTMTDNTATVTISLSMNWLKENHLHLVDSDDRRLSLVRKGDNLTKELELFTQWKAHSYQPLPYQVVDTEAAQDRTELLQTIIKELEKKIKRLIEEGFVLDASSSLETVPASQRMVGDAVKRARARLEADEDTRDVHVMMGRLDLW